MKKILALGGLATVMSSCFVIGGSGGSDGGTAINYNPYNVTASEVVSRQAVYCKNPSSSILVSWQANVNFNKADVILLKEGTNPNNISGAIGTEGYNTLSFNPATSKATTTVTYGQGTDTSVNTQGITITANQPNINVYVRNYNVGSTQPTPWVKAAGTLKYSCQ